MVKKHSEKKTIKKQLKDSKKKGLKIRDSESSDDSEEEANVFGSDHDDFYAPELDSQNQDD